MSTNKTNMSEDEKITLCLPKLTLQKARRAYNIYKAEQSKYRSLAVPSKYRSSAECNVTFEEWLADRVMELDEKRERMRRVRLMLLGGLTTDDIRAVLKHGDYIIRTEENMILDEVDSLVEKKGLYAYEIISQAIRRANSREGDEALKVDIDIYNNLIRGVVENDTC